jgi:hypothetical protein
VLIALRDDTSTVVTDTRWAVVRVVVDHAPAELHVDARGLCGRRRITAAEPFFSRN